MGSASLFYATKPRKAILSDLNQELVRTVISVRNHPRAVYNRLVAIPRGKDNYIRLRAVNPSSLEPLERAARFLFLNRYCFNGIYRTNSKGGFNVPYAPSKTGGLPSWPNFFAAARRLKSATILCGDFEKIIVPNVREGDFVYLDPPYAVENRRVFKQYGPQTFGLEDLKRLSRTVSRINRRGAKFVLSYAYSPEAIRLFQRWTARKVFTLRNVSGFAKHRRMAAELIVTNICLKDKGGS